MVCRGYSRFVSGEEHLWSEFIYYMEKTEDGFAMSNDQERRAPSVCRSMYMCMEEIDRERAQSGWNPYAGEEEPDKKPSWLPQEILNTGTKQARLNAVPRFQVPDREALMQQEQEFEQDLQRLQSLYPKSAVLLLPYIEEACEKMEYDGSQMYLIYPDREMLNRIVAGIYEAVRDLLPPAEEPVRDEMLIMQSCESVRKPGENRVEDMIRCMLLQEMYRRRCRHARCRRGFM